MIDPDFDPSAPKPPAVPSSKVWISSKELLVYYEHGSEVRTERVPAVNFNADRVGYYSRWKREL